MSTSLHSLPSELVATILSYLSIPSLLAFSATCLVNRQLAQNALHELNLAIFPRKMHCRLALMSQQVYSGEEFLDSSPYNVSRTTFLPTKGPMRNMNPSIVIQQQVSAQNRIAAEIFSNAAVHNLRNLTLQMYDIRSVELTSAIATNLSKLKHLDMKFCHQYVHDSSLPTNYWRDASDGHPCWNALVGLGAVNQQKLCLRGLHSLKIERAGLTSRQLRSFVEANPELRRIYFNNITGVDLDFANWLAVYCESGKSKLEVIELESCPKLILQRMEDFAWLSGITQSSVSYLSLSKCKNVRNEILLDLITTGAGCGFKLDKLETIIPPRGPSRYYGVVRENIYGPISVELQAQVGPYRNIDEIPKIDVDPEYCTQLLAVAA